MSQLRGRKGGGGGDDERMTRPLPMASGECEQELKAGGAGEGAGGVLRAQHAAGIRCICLLF